MTRTELINAARLSTRIMNLEIAIKDAESMIAESRRLLADDDQPEHHRCSARSVESYSVRLAALKSELSELRAA